MKMRHKLMARCAWRAALRCWWESRVPVEGMALMELGQFRDEVSNWHRQFRSVR